MPAQGRALGIVAAVALAAAASAGNPAVAQVAGHVVISEIYGGGGNSGALYTHDFIELYNPTAAAVVMTDWSLQYQSGGGTGPFGAVARFSGIIASHGFFLVQANPGSGGTTPLPTPDAVAGFALAAASGKVALCSDTVPVSGPGLPGVIDFVGYGGANLFEGTTPAPAPGNTTSVERKASGGSDATSMSPGGGEEGSGNGYDSGENGQDFIRRDPEPQNASSALEAPGGSVSVSTGYGDRWNLVSVPLDVPDPSVAALFPGGVSPLFSYDFGYLPETSAIRGKGYWIRFAAPETVTFTGTPGEADTIAVSPGWNLIGSGSAPVGVDQVVQEPEGHLSSDFYGYGSGYVVADTIRPGRAYWVRSSSGGRIVLSTGSSGGRRTRISSPVPPEFPPPPHPREDDGEERGPVEDAPGTVRLVAAPASGAAGAGEQVVSRDGRRDDGGLVSGGIYLIRVVAGARRGAGTVVRLK